VVFALNLNVLAKWVSCSFFRSSLIYLFIYLFIL